MPLLVSMYLFMHANKIPVKRKETTPVKQQNNEMWNPTPVSQHRTGSQAVPLSKLFLSSLPQKFLFSLLTADRNGWIWRKKRTTSSTATAWYFTMTHTPDTHTYIEASRFWVRHAYVHQSPNGCSPLLMQMPAGEGDDISQWHTATGSQLKNTVAGHTWISGRTSADDNVVPLCLSAFHSLSHTLLALLSSTMCVQNLHNTLLACIPPLLVKWRLYIKTHLKGVALVSSL